MWHNIRGTEGAELLFPNSDRKTTFLFIHPDWSSSVWSLATAHNVWSLREQVTPLLSLAGGTKMFSRWVQPKSVCVHKATEDGHVCRMPPASVCSYFDRITILYDTTPFAILFSSYWSVFLKGHMCCPPQNSLSSLNIQVKCQDFKDFYKI